jgi:hypothetical protein
MRWLAEQALADEVGFVAARCAFEGMALLKPYDALRGLDLRTALTAKYEQLDQRSRAVERLRDALMDARR